MALCNTISTTSIQQVKWSGCHCEYLFMAHVSAMNKTREAVN
jgi:hypothetical protein